MVCFIFCFSFIKKIRGIKLSSFVKVLWGERFGLSADIGRSQSRPRRLSAEDPVLSRTDVLPTVWHVSTSPTCRGWESLPRRARSQPWHRRCSEARNPHCSRLPVTPRFRGLDTTGDPKPWCQGDAGAGLPGLAHHHRGEKASTLVPHLFSSCSFPISALSEICPGPWIRNLTPTHQALGTGAAGSTGSARKRRATAPAAEPRPTGNISPSTRRAAATLGPFPFPTGNPLPAASIC